MHASILGETGVGTKRVGGVLCPEWFTPATPACWDGCGPASP